MSEQHTEKEAIVRFTVDMPLSMHDELSLLAMKHRQPKAVLVRKAIEQMLKNQQENLQ